MSQIHGINNAPNPNQVEVAQGQPQAARAANTGQGQRINDIVNQVELLPYQQRRAERSTGQQVAYVLARVVGAVLTLGVSEGIIAIGHKAEARNAEMLRQQALDRRAATAQFNRSLADAVKTGAALPENHQAAVGDAIAQLRERFGEDLVPANVQNIKDLPHAFDIKSAVRAAISEVQEEFTPEALRNAIVEKAAPSLARKAGELALGQAFQNLNFKADAEVRYTGLVAKYPELKAELEACRDRSSVDNVLGEWKDRIEGYAIYFKSMADGKKAALEHAIQRFADKVGVSVEAMGRALDTKKLSTSFAYLEFKIGTPEAQIRQAYIDKAESFLEKKFAMLDSVDQLPVTQELKAYWKNETLADAILSSADTFTKAVEAASKVSKSKIEGIEALFSNGMPDADTVYAALLSLSIELHEAEMDVYGFDGFRDLGGDGQGEARFHTSKALLSRMPNFQAALEQYPDLLSQLHDRAGEDLRAKDEVRHYGGAQADFLLIAIQTKSVDNAQLATSLGDLNQMPVHFLAALNHAEAAVRANFADMGLPDDLLSYHPGIGSKLGEALKNAVAQAEAPLTPAQFSELAQSTMNNALASAVLLPRVRELAAEGQALQQYQDVWVARAVIRRHPELSEAFASGDAATVRAALGKLDGEVAALVHLRQDLNAAWAAGEAHLFNRLAETIGMDEQELRATLNLAGVTFGGSFAYKQADILEEMEKPGGVIPGREALKGEFEAIAQKFVGRKSALYQSIDSFGLPAEAAAELKKSVLRDSTLKMPDFLTRCSDAAKFIAAGPLRDMLHDGPVSKESLLEMLGQMAGHYEAASHVFFPQDILNDMGSDETGAIQRYTLQIFFARNPDLKGALPREIAADVDDTASEEAMRMVSVVGGAADLPPEERTALMQQYANAIVTYAFVTNMMPQD